MTRHVYTLILLAVTRTLHAQSAPQVLHTQITTTNSLTQSFEAAKHNAQPNWLGYSIALQPGMQLDANSTGTLDLNNEGSSYTRSNPSPATPDRGVLLIHTEQGQVDRIRLVDPARILDAGDQPFTWVNGVNPTQSIQLLTTIARSETTTARSEHRARSGALFAIAAHNAPEATSALVDLTAPSNSLDLRDKAAFWLAAQRGHDGFLALQHASRNDADDAFRKKLTFDLTLVKEPAALDELIRMAHSDSSSEVRKQAQFWMANKGGVKVAGDLRNIATNDPDSAVRKSAVFAISRLPGGRVHHPSHRAGQHEQGPRRPQAGRLLARAVEGSPRPRLPHEFDQAVSMGLVNGNTSSEGRGSIPRPTFCLHSLEWDVACLASGWKRRLSPCEKAPRRQDETDPQNTPRKSSSEDFAQIRRKNLPPALE